LRVSIKASITILQRFILFVKCKKLAKCGGPNMVDISEKDFEAIEALLLAGGPDSEI